MLRPSRSRAKRRAPVIASVLAVVALASACGDDSVAGEGDWVRPTARPSMGAGDPPSSSDTTDANTPPEPTRPVPGASRTSVSVPITSSPATTTTVTASTTTTTIDPADVAHAFPVDPAASSSFTPQGHSNYQATDIFSSAGCGTRLVSPVTGVVDEVLANSYDPAVDDPATRGGNAVSIIGDDGVRYYLAHFQLIEPAVTPGARVTAGDPLGEMGETGRAGACHLHFGLSLDCPTADDWWIRRGVIWPDPYLESWRNGENLSPRPALEEWFAEYPDACTSVEATPYPVS